MNESNEELLDKHLTVDELLKTRGIYTRVLDEYTQVSRVLPTRGDKFFEPNGSWLENKQIDTNLQTTKDLLKLERVNRISAMASAQWIPEEKRAKVTKKSGIDWNNYGHTLNSITYLIPEEALLLLETNNLELTCDGVSLSIQQAYELLINSPNSGCTLDEYRVFSQLARLGYRLQKFYYSKTTAEKLEESLQPKKKVIIDPENGKWMGSVSEHSTSHNLDLAKSNEENKGVEEVINSIIDKIEIKENELRNSEKSVEEVRIQKNGGSKIDTNDDELNEEKKEKLKERSKPRLEIVSEETVVEPVKLMIPPNKSLDPDCDTKFTWPGSRIQRNVKLLPKRTDKKILLFSSHQSKNDKKTSDQNSDKRKSESIDPKLHKKSKHEIIELSDDDIEEIPIAMTRMEMLNCFPNIASKDSITQVISKNYIPPSIKLQKNFYEYDRDQLSRMRQSRHSDENTDSEVSEITENNQEHSCESDSTELSLHSNSRSTVSTHVFERSRPWSNTLLRDNQIWQDDYQQSFFQNGQGNYFYSNRFSNSQFSRGGCTSNNFIQHKIMASCSTGSQGFFSAQTPLSITERYPQSKQILQIKAKSSNQLNGDEKDQTSFLKIPASSWSDLKKKWKEAKTITIEDEDDKMDCSEVEVVEQTVQPLINIKNVKTFAEVYERLKIIKPAQEKTVRKKKGEYKISYKVYSNTQNYKKSSPGPPMFHLVITSINKNFPQPVELNRLQQDGESVAVVFAFVSEATISFMQAGIVSLPNLVDNK
ncbi:uncharacterized protein Tsen54 isoform X2 [Chelonus insularis]|uniref:uncharacterized protein Tsen54 isoform X2 n=1 Tax=Chelonus insularis TaxID=460826 RepID=UPI00158ABC1B|nr:uncharacterized protein LOC118065949 isoform X2 [Chelonus insularis]